MTGSPEVPRGPLAKTAAVVKRWAGPMVAWMGRDGQVVTGNSGLTQVGVDANGNPVYADLSSGRSSYFDSLDDWRSRL